LTKKLQNIINLKNVNSKKIFKKNLRIYMTKKNFNIIFKISWQLLEILTTIGCFDSSKFVQKT